MLVDSCIDGITKAPAALSYLNGIGVDPAQDVKIIVASHWHDDHIRGLSTVVEACPNARFVLSDAMQNREFVALVDGADRLMDTNGVKEFKEILALLNQRAGTRTVPKLEWARANTTLLRANTDSALPEFVLTALSPSNAAITKSKVEFAEQLNNQVSTKRRISPLKPNDTSVVLWLQWNNESILLGSDLEEKLDESMGWSAIIQSEERPRGKANIYKVAHHGSETGDHPEIWKRLLSDACWAVLTPFTRGQAALPKSSDVRRICEHTSKAYLTSSPQRQKPKARDSAVERMMRNVTKSRSLAEPPLGHIRLRKQMGTTGEWTHELFDGAISLSQLMAS